MCGPSICRGFKDGSANQIGGPISATAGDHLPGVTADAGQEICNYYCPGSATNPCERITVDCSTSTGTGCAGEGLDIFYCGEENGIDRGTSDPNWHYITINGNEGWGYCSQICGPAT